MSRSLSPGIAFGCSDLLAAACRNTLTPSAVLSLSLGSARPVDVLNAAMSLRWLELTPEGILAATPRGERALAESDARRRLRLLVLDHVEVENPTWLHLAPAGRRETLLHAPPGVRQILVEAGLAYGDDEDTVAFWDGLASRARGFRDTSLSEIGRRGERLTVERETARTGRSPKWIALDSSSDGYDVLSTVSAVDAQRLTIEVKTSEQPLSGAVFHLTRNEWETASESLNHAFHLWDLSGRCPRLAVLAVPEAASHIPADSGDGSWESVAIPFRAFAGRFADCP